MQSPLRWSWLLGPSGRRRTVVRMVVLQMGLWVTFAFLHLIAISWGYIDRDNSPWLMAFYLGGSAIFYILVRFGWSERWSPGDPGLTLWQTLHGLIALLWGYSIAAPIRGGLLAVMILTLTYGMFVLPPRQNRWISAIVLLSLGVLMATLSQLHPKQYPFGVEFFHWMDCLVVVLGMGELSGRMTHMRERLSEQKQELAASLEQNRKLATLDELTGLVNRRHMGALLSIERDRQRRYGQTLSVVLLDLDYFKRINDTYGHQGGDLVLQTFAEVVQDTVRSTDVVSRWGGEEFLLMFPSTPESQARCVLERMQQAVAAIAWPPSVEGLVLTFSAGLVVCGTEMSTEQAIEVVDLALYRAKETGRNRICSA